jgi:hypothetical protein
VKSDADHEGHEEHEVYDQKYPNLRGLRVLRGELSRRDAATSPNTEVESTPKRKKKGKTKHGSDDNGKTEITAQNDAGTGMPHRAELQ